MTTKSNGKDRIVRIGGASAFITDSQIAARQLLDGGEVDYLVFDFLAEVTLSILGKAKARRPDAGYAEEFVSVILRDVLADAQRRRVRIVANAGGVNLPACRAAIEGLARELDLSLNIAIVEGDDLMSRCAELRSCGLREMATGIEMPATMQSLNAYLGAFPIARALDRGADLVITGRCVDSALTLGPLIHEFGWSPRDLDRLAQGSLAGHIIECGAQATGGLFTDWEEVRGWANIGYPVLECQPSGTFVVTKPPGTGGLVSRATVAEQMLYEVGDPSRYLLPDVICDFTGVEIEDVAPGENGEQRVEVRGARGLEPSPFYKVCGTWSDGWRCMAILPVIGRDARRKAERQARAVVERVETMFADGGLAPFRAVWIENLGAEASYGAHSRTADTREVVCKLAVEHESRPALEIFAREAQSPVTSMAVGSAGWFATGRPRPSSVVRLYSFLIKKGEVPVTVEVGGKKEVVEAERFEKKNQAEGTVRTTAGQRKREVWAPAHETLSGLNGSLEEESADVRDVSLRNAEARWEQEGGALKRGRGASAQSGKKRIPLFELAWARSGDKGDSFNVGVIARKPEYLPLIREALTAEAAREWMKHVFVGAKNPRVERFELAGIGALNFVFYEALGGGGFGSLRVDPLAKGMAQQLLEFEVEI